MTTKKLSKLDQSALKGVISIMPHIEANLNGEPLMVDGTLTAAGAQYINNIALLPGFRAVLRQWAEDAGDHTLKCDHGREYGYILRQWRNTGGKGYPTSRGAALECLRVDRQ